jgi:hypothetical protein
MGAWGIGLYSGDFAQDLRAGVRAVSRLPFAPEKLLDLLHEAEPAAAGASNDPDHTVFWLVVADQFSARGVDCPPARERALAIIDGGADLAAMKSLGMDEKSLAKRRAMLAELRARLAAPVAGKARKVMKAPQKLLLQPGEALAYPVDAKGKLINPYIAGTKWESVHNWQPAAWGACVVAECGHVFEFLAWYRVLVVAAPFTSMPTLAELRTPRRWLLRQPGTLTAPHIKKMQMTPLGPVAIDPARLERLFPQRGSAVSCTVADISLANNLNPRDLGPHEAHRVKHGYPPTPKIEALAEVMAGG